MNKLLPDFLGIGAQRSGSTWLYENLRSHPQIWMSPIKEIHFFDELGQPFLGNKKNYKQKLKRRLYKTLQRIQNLERSFVGSLLWDANYFLRRRTPSWYVSLFQPKSHQVAGEITPKYAVLDTEVIETIRQINPKMKMLFLMRDPIQRAWSQAIRVLAKTKQRPTESVSEKEFLDYIKKRSVRKPSAYLETLENWESVFPAEQIFTGFFEEITDQPKDFLRKIFRFLGVSDSESYLSLTIREKVNSSGKYNMPIPSQVERSLAKQYLPQLQALSARFGSPATDWLKRAEGILKDSE